MIPIDIHPDEKIHLKLRKHWIILIRDTGTTVLLSVLPFILFGVLGITLPVPINFSGIVPLGALLSALWLLAIWMTLAVLWTNHYLDMWVVTNQRIVNVDQIGLFNRKVTTLELENIQEITVKTENVFETFLGFGTINIETASPENDVLMEGVPHPERIRTLLLEEANRFRQVEGDHVAQKEMLRTASHEIKNYLAKDAAALASIAEGDFAKNPDMLRSMAGTALSETRKGVQAVMAMLNADGKTTLDAAPFDLAESVRTIAHEYEVAARQKNLEFTVTAPGTMMVNGDEEKISRILIKNLLDNAIRYTPGGSVSVTLQKAGTMVRLAIADTGVGLSEDDKAKLFTAGGKGDGSSEVNPESTGYGLFVVKGLVEAHSGRIWAESGGKGKGSTFIVELPAAS